MARFTASALGALLFWGTNAFAQAVTVFAASSLTDAIGEIGKACAASIGVTVKTSYAASSTLARQIENGASADLFFSADEQWMDYLEKRSLVEPGTRVSLLGNRLVLIGPAGARRVDVRRGMDLAGMLGTRGRLATGDPASVPVGRYAEQALTWLGEWRAIAPRLARTENVRMALIFVERGEAPLGIVYATDAAVSKGVQVIGEFPEESHQPVSYPVAILARHATPQAREFYAFVRTPAATAVFRKYGFSVRGVQ